MTDTEAMNERYRIAGTGGGIAAGEGRANCGGMARIEEHPSWPVLSDLMMTLEVGNRAA